MFPPYNTPDRLNIKLLVPASMDNDETAKSAHIQILAAESIFQAAGWNIRFDFDATIVTGPGQPWDAFGNVNLGAGTLTAARVLLNKLLNGAPRRSYAIFLCQNVTQPSTGVDGSSNDVGINGVSWVGTAISVLGRMAPKQTIGDKDGQTWAHEIGHGLGLFHDFDPNNLMYYSRRNDQPDPSGYYPLSGYQLAPGQVATMRQVFGQLVSNNNPGG
jgi:hypothetical protein